MSLTGPLPYLLLPALLAAGAIAAPPAPRAPSQSTPAASSLPDYGPGYGEVVEVNLVDIDVAVTDRAGNRVTGLRKGDFALFEDGKPMEITNFAAAEAPARSPSRTAAGAAPAAREPDAAANATEGAGREPLQLVVFVDDLHLEPAHRTRALRQLRQFLRERIARDDSVMLVVEDTGFAVRVPFTSDPSAWNAALDRIEATVPSGSHEQNDRRQAWRSIMTIRDALASAGEDTCAKEIEQPVRAYAGSARRSVQYTLGAMTLLVNSLSGVPGRKALLHVSDGLPLTPGEELFQALYELCSGNGDPSLAPASVGSRHLLPPGHSGDSNPYTVGSHALLDAQEYSATREFHRLASHASANRVTLYMLQAGGLQGNTAASAEFDPNERMLQSMPVSSALRANLRDSLSLLADETGGRAILDANDLRPELDRMQDDFANYYSLAFAPPHHGDGRTHAIQVRINSPGVRAVYRKSYRDKPPLERAADRTLTALLTGAGDNPPDVQFEVGEPLAGQDGLFGVPIHLRIPLFKLGIANRQGSFAGQLRLLVATRGDDGRPSPVRQVKVPINIAREDILVAMGKYFLYNVTLQLPKGDNRFAIAVRDELASTSSFVSGTVRVPAPPAGKASMPPGPAWGY